MRKLKAAKAVAIRKEVLLTVEDVSIVIIDDENDTDLGLFVV